MGIAITMIMLGFDHDDVSDAYAATVVKFWKFRVIESD